MAALAGLVFLAGPLAAPASAQVFGSTPYAPAPDPAMDAMRTRVETMEAELKRATSRTEQLTYDLTQTRRVAEEANAGRIKAEKALEEMTARVDALERLARGEQPAAGELPRNAAGATISLLPDDDAKPAAAPSETATVDLSQLPQDEAGLLKEARNLLLEGRYASAQAAFSHYLSTHGKSASAHEAQYMLGESMLYQNDLAGAADAYGKLLSAYPKSSFGPMGLVKLSRSMRLMNKKTEACRALALMPAQFPKAPAEAKELAATERQRAGC